MKQKKRYTSEEKTIILREHLENQVPISDLAEKYGIHPNAIYVWKKKMFEFAPENFSNVRKKHKKIHSVQEKRIRELEEILSKRESVIAELASDNIELKKKLIGDNSIINGSNLRSENR
jgi:transposase